MGGHVTGIVAEQWPQSYDGAMPICGVLGDYELFDYFLDFNVAAQTLSGVGKIIPLRGRLPDQPPCPRPRPALGPAFPFALNAGGQNFKSLVQLRSGGVRPLFEQGFLFWNGVCRRLPVRARGRRRHAAAPARRRRAELRRGLSVRHRPRASRRPRPRSTQPCSA